MMAEGEARVHTLWQDFRYGARRLMKAPIVTVVASLSLGLAIGANATIFSLLDTMFYRPLSVEEPNRLVRLHTGTAELPQAGSRILTSRTTETKPSRLPV